MDTVRENGINGQVDLNEFDGTEADLKTKYGPKKEEPTVIEGMLTRYVNELAKIGPRLRQTVTLTAASQELRLPGNKRPSL